MDIRHGNIDSGTENGIEWATRHAPFGGAVNGYVHIPPQHPWRACELQMGRPHVEVHGGITYGPDGDGWIGFDTLHFGDIWPGSDSLLDPLFPPFDLLDTDHVWTAEKVADEARSLARLVAEAMTGGCE